MADIIVRKLDSAVVERLKSRAALHGQSLEQEVRDTLTASVKLKPEERPQLYISTGSEDFLLEENREFIRLLSELKVPYEYREFPGKHEWTVWDREIQVVLALQAPVIGAQRSAAE